MESTSQTTPNAPAPDTGAPVVEYIRTQRQSAGYLLAFLAVAFLALTAYLAMQAYRSPVSADKSPDKPAAENPFDPEKPPELPKVGNEMANLKRGDYTVGWVGTMLAFLITGAASAYLLAGPVAASVEQQRADARVLLLALGGLLGSVLILFGLWYFYRWSDSLVNWIDKGETKEARWVLIPILMTVLGAGIVFLAIQPARADERNNAPVRRLVYGANFGLTVLLLLVALVVANVLFAVRVPNKLDTTETGFYSISENTTDLLRRLDPPVTAYVILPDSGHRLIGDIRQFLMGAQDASDGKFKVKFIGTVGNQVELNTLLSKYPKLELTLNQRGNIGAVVLTAGADEKRHVVIPNDEFFTSTRDGQQSFTGESRLFKELALFADNQVKPVVYFTQSNGELSMTPEDPSPDIQRGTRLRGYLEKNYLEVRTLNLALDNPSIPDDAAVVVIAGPQVPFSEAAVGALRKYVNTPRASDGKKGKLVVLAGIVSGPGGKGVMKTGLEGLLSELNVGLGDKYIYTIPSQQNPNPLDTLARFSRAVLVENHPIAVAIATATPVVALSRPREVTPLPAAPGLQAKTLLETVDITWREEDRLEDPVAAFQQFQGNRNLIVAKNALERGRPLAVVVSEGPTSRLAVFGSSQFVSDFAARRAPPDSAPYEFDLLGVTIDWLRERPSVSAVGIEAKKYHEYTFPEPASVDTSRLLYLPLTLGVLIVVGLGAGVWVIRRK